MTFNRPHKAASRDALSRWVRNVMTAAGVDMAMYSPHSVRGDGTSAALRRGLPIDNILKTADRYNSSTFGKYSNRPIRNETFFSHAILK